MIEIDLDELVENLMQCRRCGICRNAVYEDRGFDGVCPVWRNSSGFETSFMRGRIQVALALLDGTLEKTPENAESLFTCTLCGNCTEICAAEFDPTECLEKVRAVLNDIPNDVHDTIAEKIMKYDNPYEEDNKIKRNWVKEVGFDVPTTGEVLYYTGCTAGMRLPNIAKSTAKILKAAGIDFAVLEEEPCCGSVMLRTGRVEDAQKNAEKFVEVIKNSGAKKILVTCAGCLKTLRNDYPKLGLELPEILHITEALQEIVQGKKLKLKPLGKGVKVTYHDPCHLSRAAGVYDDPREIIRSIPGVELVEMETNRNTAMCCGAGGGLRSYDAELSKRMAADRVKSAMEIDAEIIATACPFCENNLEAGAKQIESKIRVVDVVDLLAESLK
ncbi:MAG: CoB--CoM heterodisulfide reductase iron-sulfur subunit D [Candidatus Thorarchaeota archaeon AB_25]|nr:MAG: CoB--CoM heterodisulfide reductase iron-sulfur subunit D [Candidatus Thorarchaeota archaeon AB_25]